MLEGRDGGERGNRQPAEAPSPRRGRPPWSQRPGGVSQRFKLNLEELICFQQEARTVHLCRYVGQSSWSGNARELLCLLGDKATEAVTIPTVSFDGFLHRYVPTGQHYIQP